MIRFAALLLVVVSCSLACATGGGRLDAESLDPAPWTSLEPHRAPDGFSFAIVSDRSGGIRPGVFETAIEKLNLLQPEFVMSVGDLIEGYVDDESEIRRQWDDFDAMLERLEMPFFYTAGNHDFSNERMSRLWRERLGSSYYHFRYHDVLFLVLNSELIHGYALGGTPVPGPDNAAAQLAYARAALTAEADARWTFVFVHQPLWDQRDVDPGWLEIESLLGDRPYTVFAGHHHRYTALERHDRRFVTLASTGGSSRLRGFDHGEFDHVLWVTMGKTRPVFANVMLSGVKGIDVRTLATRSLEQKLKSALRAERVKTSTDRFRSGIARYVVTNPLESPLEVRAELRASRDLVPAVPELARSVEPGASEVIEIAFSARAPAAVGAFTPATASFTLAAPKEDGEASEFVIESWLQPSRDFPCGAAKSDVAIDGKLGEWSSFPYRIEPRPASREAPKGAHLAFAVACGADGVYIAGQVVDPTPFSSTSRIARGQDHVSVSMDARPQPERDTNESLTSARSSGSLLQMLQARLLPGEAQPDPLLGRYVPALPEGVREATRRTPNGYAFEVVIPANWLDEQQGKAWKSFRLDVGLQDMNEAGTYAVTHWWRPNRFGFGVLPVEGTGTFIRR